MTPEQTLLAALHADPGDDLAWLALADWLEEEGRAEQAELLRLSRQLRDLPREAIDRKVAERRLGSLIEKGTRPFRPELVNELGMRLTLIPAGRFHMGAPEDEERRHEDEFLHEVELTQPYYLSVNLVTQSQYFQIMGHNPSSYPQLDMSANDTQMPVESVSWEDAMEFCRRLGVREKDRVYRLPTEAEWEYACQTRTTAPFHFGSSLCARQANFDGSSPYGTVEIGPHLGKPVSVGSYLPNAWGIHDMHGNLDEWCLDWYSEDYYQSSPRLDPRGPVEGGMRCMRGGTYSNSARFLRAAFRWRASPDYRHMEKGFRVVLEHRESS